MGSNMAEKDQASNAVLVEQIVIRQKFVEDVIRYTSSVLFEKGKVISRIVHRGCTTIERELKDDDFLFYHCRRDFLDSGETVRVWHCIGSDSSLRQLVLEVEWWDVKGCKVKHFEASMYWQDAIRLRIEEMDLELQRKKEEKENEEKAKAIKALRENALMEAEQLRRDIVQKTVQVEAKRLGMIL